MVAMHPSFLTDDNDLARDLAATERVLSRLLSMRPWNPEMDRKLEQQIDACRRHRELQRANVEAAT